MQGIKGVAVVACGKPLIYAHLRSYNIEMGNGINNGQAEN